MARHEAPPARQRSVSQQRCRRWCAATWLTCRCPHLQKSKRGKVASRPSREKQLAQLQAEEAAYQQQQLQARLGTTAATPRPATAAARADANDYDDDDDRDVSVPEQITDRMLQRMILFTGVPVLAGVLLLPGFYYLKKVQDLDIPVWAVYIVQSLAFGGGLLGITYGIVSASWDPRRDGSLLGWTEFQANLPLLLDRFKTKK